jgi:ABC-type transport system involved in cytochrome c biogenesis permease subunit
MEDFKGLGVIFGLVVIPMSALYGSAEVVSWAIVGAVAFLFWTVWHDGGGGEKE